MRTDFSTYKFRCSSLGKLMVGASIGLTQKQEELFQQLDARHRGEGKPLTEKQKETYGDLMKRKHAKPKLSTTTKTYLQDLHREEIFGRSKEITAKYMDKGVQVEEESISLYSKVSGRPFFKNKERRENDYITGDPDNTFQKIRDMKNSWDFYTFPMYEKEIPNKDYYWQLQGYKELWDMEESELIYTLVDTPEMLIMDEIRRTGWKAGMIDVPEELENEIERNLTYSDIPDSMRVKVFHLKRDREAIKALYKQIELCRDYMNSLSESIQIPVENGQL